MEHALPRVGSHIRYQPVAGFIDIQLARDMRSHPKQFARQCVMLLLQRGDILYVLFRDNEYMHWRLRVQVLEGIYVLIFVHAGRRYLLLCDSAKDAVLHPHALLK